MFNNTKISSKQVGIMSLLNRLEAYLIKLGLLNDNTKPRTSDMDGRIYSSYSPSHPKAGLRVAHSHTSEPPRGYAEAWNDMEPWRRNVLSVVMTAFVTGFIIFMMMIFVFPN